MDELLAHATTFTFVPAGTDRADMDTRHFRVKVEWRGDDEAERHLMRYIPKDRTEVLQRLAEAREEYAADE
jgi:hypothetical protein